MPVNYKKCQKSCIQSFNEMKIFITFAIRNNDRKLEYGRTI